MKKIALFAAIFCAFLNQANAQDEKKFYAGVGYQFNSLKLKSGEINLIDGYTYEYERSDYVAKDFSNINLFAGYQIEKNLALELGYFSKTGESKSGNFVSVVGYPVSTTTKSDLKIFNLDAIVSSNLDEKIKVLGVFGVSHVNFESKLTYGNYGYYWTQSSKDSGFGANVGFGLEGKITDNFSVRGIAKFTQVSGIDSFDNFMTYNLGAKVSF